MTGLTKSLSKQRGLFRKKRGIISADVMMRALMTSVTITRDWPHWPLNRIVEFYLVNKLKYHVNYKDCNARRRFVGYEPD